MSVLWKGTTPESRLQIQDCNILNLRKGWSPRERCVETRTHTRLRRMQMNQVQKSLSKHFAAWLFKTLSRMLIVITLRFTKEVQSIETDQKFWKSHCEQRDGSKFRKSRLRTVETDQTLAVVPKIAMDEQDSGRGQRVDGSIIGTRNPQRILDELVDGSTLEHGKLRALATSTLMDQKNLSKKNEKLMAKSLMNQEVDPR